MTRALVAAVLFGFALVPAGCGGGGEYLCTDPGDASSCTPYVPPDPSTPRPTPLPAGCVNYDAFVLYPGLTAGPPNDPYTGTLYIELKSGESFTNPNIVVELEETANYTGTVTIVDGTPPQPASSPLPSYVPTPDPGYVPYTSSNLPVAVVGVVDAFFVDTRRPPICPPQFFGLFRTDSPVRSSSRRRGM